ncbi:DUF2958 domain-containing protein [Desulfogranum marinum]|uniref:DUF2958 domain-containing protein n=1 Tax=Desulfogranum marinum TaxID=453220 RepID=UPI001963F77E|nr:DUF2958 domain-containing protein [Desulfogranum marinum]MBM9515242.1 DUF2958 domain-containing protein [Desulfogranum marinum]
MWNQPTAQRLAKIPGLYETESIPLKEKLIHLHFLMGGHDWYVAEYDGRDTFWGFAILNGDYENAEWGYFSFSELQQLSMHGWIEVDCELEDYWQIRPASKVAKICIAQGWTRSVELL